MMWHIVYVFYTETEEQAMRSCRNLAHDLSINNFNSILVDNNRVNHPEHHNADLPENFIYGTNIHHEFSGYQEGLNHILSSQCLAEDDIILFVNDTCYSNRHFLSYAPSFRRSVRASESGQFGPSHAWGEIVSFPQPVRMNDRPLERHMSTYCFAVSRAGLAASGDQIDHWGAVEHLIRDGGGFPEFAPELDPAMVERLQNWLFRENGEGRQWHKRNDVGFDVLLAKAKAILSELAVSSVLDGAGVPIYDSFRGSLADRLRFFAIRVRRTFAWKLFGKLA